MYTVWFPYLVLCLHCVGTATVKGLMSRRIVSEHIDGPGILTARVTHAPLITGSEWHRQTWDFAMS
jgi:hypothetical protein